MVVYVEKASSFKILLESFALWYFSTMIFFVLVNIKTIDFSLNFVLSFWESPNKVEIENHIHSMHPFFFFVTLNDYQR